MAACTSSTCGFCAVFSLDAFSMPKCSAELEILICKLPTRQQLSEICVTQQGQILRTISQDGNKAIKIIKFHSFANFYFKLCQLLLLCFSQGCCFSAKEILTKFESLSLLLLFVTKQSFRDVLPSSCKSALRFSSISSKQPNSEWTAGRNATLSPQICASHFAALDVHQVLHVPRKVNVTFTKYCACHEKWHACLNLVTYETSFTMRGATNVTLQTHQILRLPRKMKAQHLAKICWKQLKRHFQCAADPSRIRDGSETVPVRPQPAAQQSLLFALRTTILHWKIQHVALRLSFQISPIPAPASKSDTGPPPSILHLPRKVTPSTAPATKSDAWPSPSTAPATKSDTWPSPSILRLPRKVTRDLHQVLHLPRKVTRVHVTFTKYCACHEKWDACLNLVTYETSFTMRGATNATLQTHQILRLPRKMKAQHLAKICWKQLKRHFQCAADPRPLQAGSETVPRMNPSLLNPPRNCSEVTFRARTSVMYR